MRQRPREGQRLRERGDRPRGGTEAQREGNRDPKREDRTPDSARQRPREGMPEMREGDIDPEGETKTWVQDRHSE